LSLVGRTEERAHLRSLVAGAHAGFSEALVIRGPAGIGKTSLVEDLIGSASHLTLVRVAGIESELELPYAALHGLLLPVLDRLSDLPAPQGEAIAAAFGLLNAPSANTFLVGLATLSLLAEFSIEVPLLCIVDDAQWLDKASSQVLAFVARRLLAERIVLLLCIRDPVIGADPFRGLPELQLAGLGDQAAATLLGETMGFADHRVTQRLISVAEGNPLALKEFARNLSPSQRAGDTLIFEPLALGRRLEDQYLARTRKLSPSAQRILLLAAADPSGDLDLLLRAAELEDIDLDESLEIECQEFLEFCRPVAFHHPLIRSAIYAGASPDKLRLAHSLLASATDGELDPDRQAWHRAAASPYPDEEIASALEQSAGRAHARGGLSAEASLLIRAGQLTPDPSRRAARWLVAADSALLAGDAGQALALLTEVEPDLSTPLLKAQSQRVRCGAMTMTGRLGAAPSVYAVAARALQPIDLASARVAWLGALTTVISTSTLTENISPKALAAEALAAPLTDATAPSVDDDLLAAFATRIVFGYNVAAPMFRDALSRMGSSDHQSDLLPGNSQLVKYAAQEIWDSDGGVAALNRLAGRQRAEGALLALYFTLTGLERDALWGGHFDLAEVFSTTGRDVKLASGETASLKLTDVEAHALRGRDSEVRTVVEALESIAKMVGVGQLASICQLAVTVLGLSRGRYDEALAAAQSLYDEDPIAFGTQVLPEFVEAAVRSGDVGAARRGLQRLTERATVSGTTWALGLLARTRAIAASDSEAELQFLLAIDLLLQSNKVLDVARSHLLFGEWLRRERRQGEAREHLDAAYGTFVEIGANGFADRAFAELKAAGGRSRPRPKPSAKTLTPQEERVAGLAARGATNREIGAEMFISQATVAYHLTKIYRKLDVSSRRELARLLAIS
jgi:DNA-binding CsgD family transcriptional regulator